MEVKVLGSVSPYSRGNKNGVGYLVKEGNYKVLLDAGSGITRLMNMDEDLDNLIIKISHLHADHYEELFALAYASFVMHNLGHLNNRIKVYLPKSDKIPVLKLLKNIENYMEFIIYDDNDEIKHGEFIITSSINPHNVKSYNTKIKSKNGILVYSGDTGYKENSLYSFDKDADLFICESTFLKEQIKKEDNHLYAYEAGLISKRANVNELMLTHFWPEIDKGRYVDEARQVFKNTIAAEEEIVYKIGGKYVNKNGC